VRRVFTVLLALVLVPSIAMASWYRCELDGETRETCCCPRSPQEQQDQKDGSAPENASLSEAGCCTVIQVASADPTVRDQPPASIEGVPPPVLAVARAIEPPPRVAAVVAVDRPRALGDPPDTLLSRRCSLLL
jgi:hypothetical protein